MRLPVISGPYPDVKQVSSTNLRFEGPARKAEILCAYLLGLIHTHDDSCPSIAGGATDKETIATSQHDQFFDQLHHEAHQRCFIARSVNFPVNVEPTIRVEGRN